MGSISSRMLQKFAIVYRAIEVKGEGNGPGMSLSVLKEIPFQSTQQHI
jgi:hypothetical protein